MWILSYPHQLQSYHAARNVWGFSSRPPQNSGEVGLVAVAVFLVGMAVWASVVAAPRQKNILHF
jgi:hypothetical protein